MKFDPTVDYGIMDLSVEVHLTFWKFAELIKTLITLSSEANQQRKIIGAGAATDEMAMDFGRFFRESCHLYEAYGLITPYQIQKLAELEKALDKYPADEFPDFWNDDQLDDNKDWKTIRTLAASTLVILGMQDLRLDIDRQEKWGREGRLLSQSTRITLVR